MARYGGATWQPVRRYQPGVSGSIATRMSAYRRYGLHTAVSSAESLFNFFNQPGRATSHFYVSASGRVYQYIDTAYRSTAHLQGNHDTVTVETQDMGGPFPPWNTNTGNVPAWTAAQIEALARLGAWLHKTHGIRIQMCPNSRPGSMGFAWHRQGIDGNFPSGLLSGRVSGGELWSNARGKVCPGDRRIRQVEAIVKRAKALAGGSTTPPPPPQEVDPLMAIKGTEKEVLEKIAAAVARRENPQTDIQLGAAVRITHSTVTDPILLADGRSQTLRWLAREAHNQAAQGRAGIRDQVIPLLVTQVIPLLVTIDEKQTAVLASQAGEGTGEIVERINGHAAELRQQLEAMAADEERRHAETLDRLEAARAERADIQELVEQVGSGELAADEFVDAVSRRLARPADEDS